MVFVTNFRKTQQYPSEAGSRIRISVPTVLNDASGPFASDTLDAGSVPVACYLVLKGVLLLFVAHDRVKRPLQGAYFPHQNTKRIYIRRKSVVLPHHNFRTHVPIASCDPCHVFAFESSSQPEIEELESSICSETNVIWLEVPEDYFLSNMKIDHGPH